MTPATRPTRSTTLRGTWSEEINALGEETTYAYDADNRQISTTNALGYTSSTAYDADDEVVSQHGRAGADDDHGLRPAGRCGVDDRPDGADDG